MNLVLSGPIDPDFIREIRSIVEPARSVSIRPTALRFDEVHHHAEIRAVVTSLCCAHRVDHAFVTPEQRFANFRLLAIDMDSTLINIECIDELADIAGVGKEVKAITDAAMRGQIGDFASSLRERVRLLEGLHVDALRQVYEDRLRLTPGARDLIKEAKGAGIHTMLLSGGFKYFTERLKIELGFDSAYANTLGQIGSYLTGKVVDPIFDSIAKADAVLTNLRSLKATSARALVIGDGANDIPMMTLTPNSVAFHAKPKVRDLAATQISFGGLNVTLDYFS